MRRPYAILVMACYLLVATQSLKSQAQNSLINVQGSVESHYMNLFHGRLSSPAAFKPSPPTPGLTLAPVSPTAQFQRQSALPSIGTSTYRLDLNNPFDQFAPQLAGTIKMPLVDHSQLISLINLPRNELHRLVQQGQSPSMAEMDGLWYGFNTGNIPQVFGFSQFIKDLRTNSARPMGSNILVHQLSPSQLNSANAWTPKVDISKNRLAREGSFAVLPPDGIGPFGHTAKGVYALGGNTPNYPGNRVRTRIVKLDAQHMLGQSTFRIGGRYVHSGFFVLQRLPAGALPRE